MSKPRCSRPGFSGTRFVNRRVGLPCAFPWLPTRRVPHLWCPCISISLENPRFPKPGFPNPWYTNLQGHPTLQPVSRWHWSCVCDKNTPPDKKTCGNMSFGNSKSGGGEQLLLLLDCIVKVRAKGALSSDAGTNETCGIVEYPADTGKHPF